jgi:hypothetical protein
MFFCVALGAAPAQAGMFDVISGGLGSLKDKIASSTSATPQLACEAERNAACKAVADLLVNGGTKSNGCASLIPGEEIKKAENDVGMLSKLRGQSQSALDSEKTGPSTSSSDVKAVMESSHAFNLCAVKAYGDAIEALKGPDPATFKPVVPTVKVENLQALPKTKKVILSNFVVEFQQQYEKKKNGFSIMGLGGAGSSTAIMDATLPSQSTLQAITNFAYLDTVKKLKAKGYEVIEVSQLSAQSKSSYDKLTKTAPIKSGDVTDNIDGQSVLVTPDGMISSFPNAGCTHFGSRKTGANFSNNMRQSSTGYQTEYENEIANAEGKIPLLKVWIAVQFGEVDAKGGNAFISARQRDFLGNTKTTVSNSANASATQGMFLEPGVTHFSFELPENTSYKTNHGCGISFSDSTVTPPADGDVFIRLAEKYRDDGDSAPLKMSGQAGTVGINDTNLGGGVGMRKVKENDDGSQGQAIVKGNGTVVTQQAARTSGIVDTNEGFGDRTSLHTVNGWTANIRSDVYAASAATMIYKVTDAFIGKLP